MRTVAPFSFQITDISLTTAMCFPHRQQVALFTRPSVMACTTTPHSTQASE
jgi:hypothetical protein